MNNIKNSYDLIKFEDGDFSLDVNVSPSEDTVWLSLDEIAILFSRDKSVISRHIRNIFTEQELDKNSVIAFFATTASDGKNYIVKYYNLDMILAIGYRVKSPRGNLFRRWANSILKQYLIKGYAINESRCIAHSDNLLQMNNTINNLNNRITRHVNNIINDNELPISACAENAQTASDGKIYITKLYNLDMILAVGYRVKSPRGNLFRLFSIRNDK